MTSRTRLKRKEVDDVLGGEETWRDADQTDSECCPSVPERVAHPSSPEQCDKCDSNRAYYRQLQIRSADEPMTTCECIVLRLFVQFADGFRQSIGIFPVCLLFYARSYFSLVALNACGILARIDLPDEDIFSLGFRVALRHTPVLPLNLYEQMLRFLI